LNNNQQLILCSIINEEQETLHTVLKRVSNDTKVSLSTLKLNARILRDLELIRYNGFVTITDSGIIIKNILGDKNGRLSSSWLMM
jgi:hypothetical protein